MLLRPNLQLCVVLCKDGSADHYLCKDNISFLDVRGRITKDDALELSGPGSEIYEDIELEELEQNWDEEDDYLAQSIMDQYILRLNI